MKKFILFIVLAVGVLSQTAFSKTFDEALLDFPVMHAPWGDNVPLNAADKAVYQARIQKTVDQNPVYQKYLLLSKKLTADNAVANIRLFNNYLKQDQIYWKQEVDRGLPVTKDPHKAKTGVEMQKINTERQKDKHKFDTAVFTYKFVSEQMPAWLQELNETAQ